MLNLNGVVVVEHAQMIEEEEVGWGLGREDSWCLHHSRDGAAGLAAEQRWGLGAGAQDA